MNRGRSAAALFVTAASLSATFPGGVASGAPAGAVVDTFARADSSTLGQAETGQAWTAWSGSGRVVSEQAELSGSGYTLAVVDTGLTEATAAVSVTAVSPEYWLVVRASDGANYWRFGRWQDGGYQLQQVVGNALGAPALEVQASVTPATGDRLSCQLASTISCAVNGVAVVRTADTFNSSARFAGLASYATGGTPVRFDDVLVEAPTALPDLRVEATATSSSAPTGSPVSWTATVSNGGSATATATVATVTPPVGLAGTSVSSSAGTCSPGGSTWTCSLGDQAAQSSAIITIGGTAPSEPASLTLSVSATSSAGDADPSDNSASATVTTSSAPPPGTATASDTFGRVDSAALGSAETGQPWQAWAGTAGVVSQQAETSGTGYTLAAMDAATATGTASIRVPVVSPEYWLVVRASSATSYWRFGRWQGGGYQLQQVDNNALGSPVVTTLGSVTPAAGDLLSCSLAAELTCSVNGTAVVSTSDGFNSAATFAGFAAGSGGATRFDDFYVVPPAGTDLRVVLTGPGTVDTTAPVLWSGTVSNRGTVAATGTVVTVQVPAELASPQVTTSAGSCVPTSTTWACDVGTRAAGSTLTMTVDGVAPSSPATLTVTASAAAQETDLDGSDNSATVSTTVRAPSGGAVVQDRFNRANSTTLGTAETGQAWTTWKGEARIASQQAELRSSTYSLAVLDSGTATGAATVTVPAASSELWLVLRASDSANYWRFGRWKDGAYELQQVVKNKVGSPALTRSATVSAVGGDVLSCQLESTITCSVNGITVVSTPDGFNATARFVGLAANGRAVTRFDDFSVAVASGAPDLRVTVTASASAVQTGAAVSWNATVRNDGAATATGTVVTVTPPAELAGTTVSSSVGSCVNVVPTWQCAVGDRLPGSSLTVTVTGTAPTEPTTLTTSVSAAAEEVDSDPASNTASASVEVWEPMATTPPVTDNFERPDSSTLGTTDTGQPWSTLVGSFGVSAGTAAPGGPGTNVAVVDPGWQYGTYEVTVTAGAAPNAFAVVVRGRDAGNSIRLGPDSSGFYRLWKVVDGSAQSLTYSLRRADVAPGDGDRIRIVNRPDDGLFVSVNGRHILDAGDQYLLAERRFGLVASSTAVRFDSVWISPLMSSRVTTVDTFSDPDGTPLHESLTESGTHYPWRASPGMTSENGQLVTWGYAEAWVDTTSEVADVRVDVLSGGAEAWLRFRYSETGDYYRFGHREGGTYVVERVVGGSSMPGAGSVTATVVPGAADVLEVRQRADGLIECYVDGVRIASFLDTSFNVRATAYGLAGDGAVFDDFTAVAE